METPRRFDVVLRAGYLIFSAATLVPLVAQAASTGWQPAGLVLIGLVVAAAVLQVTPTPAVLPLATMVTGMAYSVVLTGRGVETSPSLLLGLVNYLVVSRLTLRPALVSAPAVAGGYVLLTTVEAPSLGWRPYDDAVLGLSLCLAPIVFVHLLNRQLAAVQRVRAVQASRQQATAIADAERRLAERSRRLLHDEVIGLLNMIADHADGRDERLRAGARRVAERLAAGVGAEAETVSADSIGALLDQAAAQVLLHVDDTRVDRALPVREEHAGAVLGALGEALRNAQRHAGLDRVSVAAGREGDWLVVEVVDDGAGPRGASPGFGMRHSVIGPMRELGGEATLRPGASGGTTLRLRWPAGAGTTPDSPSDSPSDAPSDSASDVEAEPPSDRLARAHAELTRALGDQGWLGFLIAVPTLAGNLFVALRYLWGDPTWAAQALLTVPVSAVTVLVVRQLRRRPLRHLEVLGLSVWTALVVHLGLGLAEPRALTGYDSWVIGLAAAAMLVTCFFLPWEGVVILLAPQLAVVGWHVHTAHLTWWQAGGAINAVVTPLVTGYVFGAYLRRARRGLDREQAVAHAEARRGHLRAAARAHDHRLHHARTVIGPWLQRFGAGDPTLDAGQVGARARSLARQARDDLYAPGVLHDALRRRIGGARARGTVVELLPGLSPDPAGGCLPILDRLLGDPDVERVVVATTPAGDRVEVVPRLSPALVGSVSTLLDGAAHRVVEDHFSTTIELPRPAREHPVASGHHRMLGPPPAC